MNGVDPAAARDAIAASDAAVGHAVCVARRRRQHAVGAAVTLTVGGVLLLAYFATVGRVPGAVSWLIVAALYINAAVSAVCVWRIRRPCRCVGDTDPFLTWLGAAPTQTTTQVDAGRDSDH